MINPNFYILGDIDVSVTINMFKSSLREFTR